MKFEDKILIVKWMGWHWNSRKINVPDQFGDYDKTIYEIFDKWFDSYEDFKWSRKCNAEDWNPDSPDCPHSVWDEIWGNMTRDEMSEYLRILLGMLYGEPWQNCGCKFYLSDVRKGHTASTEIMVKALLEMINGQKKKKA